MVNLQTYYYTKTQIDALLNNKENINNKSSSITTDTGSTTKYPTVKAVEDYAQQKGNYLTEHQSLTNYVQKSSTSGLIKNDGSIDTNNYSQQISTTRQSIQDLEQSTGLSLSQKVNTSELIDLVYPIGSIYMSVNSTSPATLFGGTWEQLTDTFLYASNTPVDNQSTTATAGTATVSLTVSQMPRHTHIQNAHTHTQNAHTHIQDAHTHTQDSHTHTQNSHTHTQNSHTHIQEAHTHTQDAHTHTQDAHNHSQNAHGHQVPDIFSGGTGGESRVIKTTGRKGGYRPWTTDATATNNATTATNQNTTATNQNTTAVNKSTTATNQSTTATNKSTTATNQNTTATNQNTIATNQNTTATNQYTGGTGTASSESNGSAHENMPPYMVVNMWKRIE